jgi:CheY-like chemotaxis protein
MAMTAAPGLLLIQGNTNLRKTLRTDLGRAGYAVLAVNSLGEARARLKVREYHLVVCSDLQRSVTWADDYELLIDRRKLLSRSGGRFELYLPAAGMGADAVLIMPCVDPLTLRSAVHEASALIDQMRAKAQLTA